MPRYRFESSLDPACPEVEVVPARAVLPEYEVTVEDELLVGYLRAGLATARARIPWLGRGQLRSSTTGRMVTAGVHSPVCPKCGGPKTPWAKVCWSCLDRHGEKRRSKPQKMSLEVLAAAEAMYEEGLSFRAIASELVHRTEYASVNSMAGGLHKQAHRHGWKVRKQGEATAIANAHRHDDLPVCGFIKASGRICRRKTSKGRCWHHRDENLKIGLLLAVKDPDRAAELYNRAVARQRTAKPAHKDNPVGGQL